MVSVKNAWEWQAEYYMRNWNPNKATIHTRQAGNTMLCVNLTLQVSTQHKRICRDSVAEWYFLSTCLHRTFQASTLHKRLGPNCAAVQSFTCVCLHVILQVTLLNKRLRAGSEAALSLPCVCVCQNVTFQVSRLHERPWADSATLSSFAFMSTEVIWYGALKRKALWAEGAPIWSFTRVLKVSTQMSLQRGTQWKSLGAEMTVKWALACADALLSY